ncbi:MAG: HAD family phosphatase [Patescibacteria group bacterium]|jgi:HAD superfamily hydrolase (TIGR01509 family)
MYPCIEAVFSDLDGTLVDSEEPLRNSWVEVIAECGHDFSRFNYLDIIGAPESEKVGIVLAFFGIKEDSQEFYRRLIAKMRERLPREMKLMPGAERFLEACVGTGAPRGLITSATQWHADLALDLFNLRRFFHPKCIITAETPGLEARKPSPAPYVMGAQRLRVKPSRCVVFEDSPHGVQAGVSAGMSVVAIPHALSPRSVLEAINRSVYVLPEGQNIGDFEFDHIEHLLPQ